MERLEQIARSYEQGLELLDIKKKFKTSTDTIFKAIAKYNIPKRNYKDLSKFKDLSNKELMYWLGFIVADGSINIVTKSRVYAVIIHNKDLGLLSNFENFAKGIHITKFEKRYTTKNGTVESVYSYGINSKELAYLFKDTYGIPCKNKAFECDPKVELDSNFILGLFDGDGSIRKQRVEGYSNYECKITMANPILLKRVVSFMMDNNIDTRIKRKGNAFDIIMDGKDNMFKFYKTMYSNNLPCIQYKKDRFVALFGNL